MRLNKFLSHAGVCSRRKADDLIKAGRVKINGEVVRILGVKIDPFEDKIEVDGRIVNLQKDYVYLAMNKPVKVISSVYDPEGRRTVIDLLPANLRKKGVVPVGRLDFMSEGLVILTNDKELVHRLTHPKHHIPKTYLVKIKGSITAKKLETIKKGMTLKEGIKLAPVKVEVVDSDSEDIHLLKMTLFQGINRQIRRMCRDMDWIVLKLLRISIGPIFLKGLDKGKFRYLSQQETVKLKHLRPFTK